MKFLVRLSLALHVPSYLRLVSMLAHHKCAASCGEYIPKGIQYATINSEQNPQPVVCLAATMDWLKV
jgi:hypothetical protein